MGGHEVARIGPGLCLFLGIAKGDTEAGARYLAQKCLELRLFEDNRGQLNRSLMDVQGAVLVVSEFTLYGDCTKGRRPSFSHAAPPAEARPLYDSFVKFLREREIEVETGQFQAQMEVALTNQGPVTFIVDSR